MGTFIHVNKAGNYKIMVGPVKKAIVGIKQLADGSETLIKKATGEYVQATIISHYTERTARSVAEGNTVQKGIYIIPVPDDTIIISTGCYPDLFEDIDDLFGFRRDPVVDDVCQSAEVVDFSEVEGHIGEYFLKTPSIDIGKRKWKYLLVNLGQKSAAQYAPVVYTHALLPNNRFYVPLTAKMLDEKTAPSTRVRVADDPDDRWVQTQGRRIIMSQTRGLYVPNYILYVFNCPRITKNEELKKEGFGLKLYNEDKFYDHVNSAELPDKIAFGPIKVIMRLTPPRSVKYSITDLSI